MSSRRRSISRNTATQREDTDLFTSRARAYLPPAPSPFRSIPQHRYRAAGGDVNAAAPCDFRVTRARSRANGQCISAGRRRVAAANRTLRDFARGNTRGKGRPDLEDSARVSLSADRQCAQGGEKKRIRARLSKPATEALFHNHRRPLIRPLSPSLRDRKADLDAESYLLARYIVLRGQGEHPAHTPRTFAWISR